MRRGGSEPDAEPTLRQRAERIAHATANPSPEAGAALSSEDLQRTVNELAVYQVELEMQNEELRRVQARMEAMQTRYFDLYDLAPVGYCSISEQGLIRESNLTVARLLGLNRGALTGQPISRFIFREDQDVYYRFHKQLFEAPANAAPPSEPVVQPRMCKLRMAKPDGAILWARLEATIAREIDSSPVCRIAIIDISSSKQAELDALNALMTAIPGVVYQFLVRPDGTWRFLYLSPGIETLYRVTAEIACANPDALTHCIHPDDRPSHRVAVERASQTLAPWCHEHRIHPSGQPDQLKWVRGQATPFPQPDGSVLWNGILTDVTEEKRIEAALRASKQQLDMALQAATMGIWDWEIATGRVAWAGEHAALFGIDLADFGGMIADVQACVHPDDREQGMRVLRRTLEEGAEFDNTYRVVWPDGSLHWMHSLGTLIRDEVGAPQRILGTTQDITERKEAEERLRESETRYRTLFDHIGSGVAIYAARDQGQEFVFRDVNYVTAQVSGLTRKELIRQLLTEVFPGVESFGLLEVLRRVWTSGIPERFPAAHYQDERLTRWYENYVYRLPSGEVVAVFDDVTALKEHERQLECLAYSDALTALPNRVLLLDRLQQAMAQTQRRGQHLAVVYLDLDGFKAINDRHGHDAGDQLLIALARRMKQTLREGDTLARLGGDEFVALLVDLGDRAASVPLLNRLLAAAAAPVPLGEVEVQVSASLGVTFHPQPITGDGEGTDALDADHLLRQADQAMYQAKRTGKNRYHVFNVEQDRRHRDRHESLERLRHALAAREFVLYYQPKVNLRSGEVIGAEALIRWRHPERGFLLPQEFLPAIEDDLLAVELGEWVIETALTQMEAWQASGLDLPVSVNIGARQLQQADFVARLSALLAAHPRVKPSSLALEVLETSAMQDLVHVAQVVADCLALGVSCALDDFGIGYSSLTYLKHLAVTVLKIDRSFVGDMLDNPDDLAIIESILGLAAAFRRQTIAEGVETLEQGERLLQLGCELAQGYRIAHPLPAHELPGWVATWRTDPRWSEWQSSAGRSQVP
jgi:diguanylate cyclase (GGDEF)-like protein/PAS domain S-box-containing protein